MGQIQRDMLTLLGGMLLTVSGPVLLLLTIITGYPLLLVLGISILLPGLVCGIGFIVDSVIDMKNARTKRRIISRTHLSSDEFDDNPSIQPTPVNTSGITKTLQFFSCSTRKQSSAPAMQDYPTRTSPPKALWSRFLSWFNKNTPKAAHGVTNYHREFVPAVLAKQRRPF